MLKLVEVFAAAILVVMMLGHYCYRDGVSAQPHGVVGTWSNRVTAV